MPDIAQLLQGLSDLRVDAQSAEGNVHVLSCVSELTDALERYIKDSTPEVALLAEFCELHESLRLDHERGLNERKASIDRLKCELQQAQASRSRAAEELRKLKNDCAALSSSSEEALAAQREAQDLKDRLHHWEQAKQQELLEVQRIKHKSSILEEKLAIHRASHKDIDQRNRILYEFISSSLNIAIVNMRDSHVNLALLSESEDGSDQTWHCLTVNDEECDLRTTDYLWDAIEKTFERDSTHPPVNAAMESLHITR